jgi:hypothetical protein
MGERASGSILRLSSVITKSGIVAWNFHPSLGACFWFCLRHVALRAVDGCSRTPYQCPEVGCWRVELPGPLPAPRVHQVGPWLDGLG